MVYLALLIVGLLGLPVSRAWWRRLWPPEQAAEYAGRSGYWAARTIRGTVFLLVFLPLAALPAASIHVLRKFWEAVTAPLRWWRWLTGGRAPARAG
jgi:hypothetical protein